jgi:hypothetical protein
MRFDAETEIAGPAEGAFDAMADARNEPRWNGQVSSSELVSDEPVREGSVFKTINRGQEYTATITAYDRPSHVAFDVTGKMMDIAVTFDFHGHGDHTHAAGSFDMNPKGFAKVLFPLLSMLIRRDLPKQMDSFRSMCEGDRALQQQSPLADAP